MYSILEKKLLKPGSFYMKEFERFLLSKKLFTFQKPKSLLFVLLLSKKTGLPQKPVLIKE
jgi:hypothetical protein